MNSTSAHSPTKLRPWQRKGLVFFAALLLALGTARLGFWQLDRAKEKTALEHALEQQAKLPPLLSSDFLRDASLWQQIHRNVELQGQWLDDKTVYLDNRTHHGQHGFWVMTPFRWAPGQLVWVQRGWVVRDPVDASKSGPVETMNSNTLITGRISNGLSHMVELNKQDTQVSASGIKIQVNLDRAQMQSMVADNVNAVVVQTGTDSEGLRRDWQVVAVNSEKNKAYAFQWFCLSGLTALLYVWFQWIGPLRHARKK